MAGGSENEAPVRDEIPAKIGAEQLHNLDGISPSTVQIVCSQPVSNINMDVVGPKNDRTIAPTVAAAEPEDDCASLLLALAQHSDSDHQSVISPFRRTVRFTYSEKWEALNAYQRQQIRSALNARSDRSCRLLASLFPEPWGGSFYSRLLRRPHDGEPPPPDGDPPLPPTRVGSTGCGDLPKIVRGIRLQLLEEAGCRLEACELCLAYSRCAVCSNRGIYCCRNYYLPMALKILHDSGDSKGMINKIANLTCHDGLEVVQEALKISDPASFLVLKSVTEILLVRDLVGASRFCCTLELMRLWCSLHAKLRSSKDMVTSETLKLGSLATSSAHLYLLADALFGQYGRSLVALYLKLYVHAFTIDLNYLEYSRLVGCDVSVLELELHIASAYMKLANLLASENDLAMARECVLTAFSLEPTAERLDYLRCWSTFQSPYDLTRATAKSVIPCTGECHCSEKGLCRRELPTPSWYCSHYPSGILDSPLGTAGVVTDQLLQDLCILVEGPRVRSLTWSLPWAELEGLCQRYLLLAGTHRPDTCSHGASIEARLELIKQKRLSLDAPVAESAAIFHVPMDIDEEEEQEIQMLPRPARVRPASVEDYVLSDGPSAEASVSPRGLMPGVQDGLSPLAENDSPVELHLSPTGERADAMIEELLRSVEMTDEVASCLNQEPVSNVPANGAVVVAKTVRLPSQSKRGLIFCTSPRAEGDRTPKMLYQLLNLASAEVQSPKLPAEVQSSNQPADRSLSADEICGHVSAELQSIGTASVRVISDVCHLTSAGPTNHRHFLESASAAAPGLANHAVQSSSGSHVPHHRIAVTGSGGGARPPPPTQAGSANGAPQRNCTTEPTTQDPVNDDEDGYRSRMSDEHKLFVDVVELLSGPRFSDATSPSLPASSTHSTPERNTSVVERTTAKPDDSSFYPVTYKPPPVFLLDHQYFTYAPNQAPPLTHEQSQRAETQPESTCSQLTNGHASSPGDSNEKSPSPPRLSNGAPLGVYGGVVTVASPPSVHYRFRTTPVKMSAPSGGILIVPTGDGNECSVTKELELRKCAGKWTATVVEEPRPGSNLGRGETSPTLPPLLPPVAASPRRSLVETQWLSMRSGSGSLTSSTVCTPAPTIATGQTSVTSTPAPLVTSPVIYTSVSPPSLPTVVASPAILGSVIIQRPMSANSTIPHRVQLSTAVTSSPTASTSPPAYVGAVSERPPSSADGVEQLGRSADGTVVSKSGKGWIAKRNAHGSLGYFKAGEELSPPRRSGGWANGRRTGSAASVLSWRPSPSTPEIVASSPTSLITTEAAFFQSPVVSCSARGVAAVVPEKIRLAPSVVTAAAPVCSSVLTYSAATNATKSSTTAATGSLSAASLSLSSSPLLLSRVSTRDVTPCTTPTPTPSSATLNGSQGGRQVNGNSLHNAKTFSAIFMNQMVRNLTPPPKETAMEMTPTAATRVTKREKSVPCGSCKRKFVSAENLRVHRKRFHVDNAAGELSTVPAAPTVADVRLGHAGVSFSHSAGVGMVTSRKPMDETEVKILRNVFPALATQEIVTAKVQPDRTLPLPTNPRSPIDANSIACSTSAVVSSKGSALRPIQVTTSIEPGKPNTLRQVRIVTAGVTELTSRVVTPKVVQICESLNPLPVSGEFVAHDHAEKLLRIDVEVSNSKPEITNDSVANGHVPSHQISCPPIVGMVGSPNTAARGRVSSRTITPSRKQSCACCKDPEAAGPKKCKIDRDKPVRKEVVVVKPSRSAPVPRPTVRPMLS